MHCYFITNFGAPVYVYIFREIKNCDLIRRLKVKKNNHRTSLKRLTYLLFKFDFENSDKTEKILPWRDVGECSDLMLSEKRFTLCMTFTQYFLYDSLQLKIKNRNLKFDFSKTKIARIFNAVILQLFLCMYLHNAAALFVILTTNRCFMHQK